MAKERSSSKSSSSSSSKKRKALSAFDQVANLEREDQTAEHLRKKQSVKDVTRAQAARSQTKIYGNLMETRILLQRTLQQVATYTNNPAKDEKESDTDDDNSDQEASSPPATPLVDECDNLLQKLLEARRKIVPGLKKKSRLSASDADEDNNNNNDEEETLQDEYDTCREEWKEILNRRHQDLKLHAGLASSSKTQFRVLDSSFWQQVESTVNHEELRQRSTRHSTDNNGSDMPFFDDSKVYQRMLKDFLVIASTGGDSGDAANTTTSLGGYQRWKSPHPKKQVDRKASKGRKIRYVEIPKLVNFTFPVSRTSHHTNNLDSDEWFKSLFGGAGNLSSNYQTKPNNRGASALVSSGDGESD